jgi:prolyl oligopeptidase
MAFQDDPYKSLEDVESQDSLDFARAANKYCLKALGDPTKSKSGSYSRILEVLQSDERIPFVSKMGTDDSGNALLYNLWKDSKVGHAVF